MQLIIFSIAFFWFCVFVCDLCFKLPLPPVSRYEPHRTSMFNGAVLEENIRLYYFSNKSDLRWPFNKNGKHWMISPYLKLLENGVAVRPCCLQWYTTKLNHFFSLCRRWNPRFQTRWFTLGSIFTCGLIPVATFVLIKTVFGFFRSQVSEVVSISEGVLQPVLLGVNIPVSDAVYYFLALLFCSILHEIGHALCAAREDVSICGVGFFVLCIFPGAFVKLPTEQVAQCTPSQRLRIFCAGVWHNLVLVALALFLLLISPVFLAPWYLNGQGLFVQYVDPESGLIGPAGLSEGDIIVNVSGCPVRDLSDWIPCLLQNWNEPKGYCVSESFLKNYPYYKKDASVKEDGCCLPNDAAGLCFAMEDNRSMCLPIRKLLESSSSHCESSQNCSTFHVCARPMLSNGSQLMQLMRLDKKPVLFLGAPQFLVQSVKLSSFIPRYSLFPPSLPYVLETQLKYLIAFSGALALLNVVPCYGLDGYHIFSAFLDWLGIFSRHKQKTLLRLATFTGSLLLTTCIAGTTYFLLQR